VGWRIEFEGEVYREGDLTLGQCERIEDVTGVNWRAIHPLRSAKEARVVLEVCVAERKGESVETVRERVNAMKVDEFLDALKVSEDEDDRPTEYVDGNPPVADEPSTPG
jgi:hypothetical protein